MKEELLKELLDKYYKGDTSLEEELFLKEFFSGDDILPGYEAEQKIFQNYYGVLDIQAPSDNLETMILNKIDDYEKHSRSGFKRIRMFASISIAAAFMVFAVSYFMLRRQAEPKDTYSNPRLAYAETMKILTEVSVKLNEGKDALKPIGVISKTAESSIGSIGKSTSLLTSNLKTIGIVNKLSGANNEIMNNNNK